MPKQAKSSGIVELWSDQVSGEVQYVRESLPIKSRASEEKIDVFLGYRRSTDFDQRNNPGQDYATVRGNSDGYLVGVVADGVSQSFYGHLAAYHLSNSLLNILWQNRKNPPSEHYLEEDLRRLEDKVATEVENHPVPNDLAALLKESLEDKRLKGSQTVFAAFVLDVHRKRLLLYQVGDVDAIVYFPDKEPEFVRAPPSGRWSSAGKSKMRLKLTTYDGSEGVTGIVMKSDGAGKDWGTRRRALTRSAFVHLAEERAGIDDLSFVAARWGNGLEAPETEELGLGESVPPPFRKEAETRSRTSRNDSIAGLRKVPLFTEAHELDSRYQPNSCLSEATGGRRGVRRSHRSSTQGHRRFQGWFRYVPHFFVGIGAGIFVTSLLAVVVYFWFLDEPPNASDYHYVIAEDELTSIRVPDNTFGALEAKVEHEASHGEVWLNADGSLEYEPEHDYTGSDYFTYSVCDDNLLSRCSEPARVTIEVEAENDAPEAYDDEYSIDEDDVLTKDRDEGVLANDSDIESNVLEVEDHDKGKADKIDPINGPENGTLTLNTDGSFEYRPDEGFDGSDYFSYRACESDTPALCSGAATATITVKPKTWLGKIGSRIIPSNK